MKNIDKIIAVMAIKTYPDDEVRVMRKIDESDNELTLGFTPEKEVEFYSEEDFIEPKRENFEDFVRDIQKEENRQKDVELKFLTELEA